MSEQIQFRGVEQGEVLVEVAERDVTEVAEQATNLPGRMTVIHVKRVCTAIHAGWRVAADRAFSILGCQHPVKVFAGDAVVPLQGTVFLCPLDSGRVIGNKLRSTNLSAPVAKPLTLALSAKPRRTAMSNI